LTWSPTKSINENFTTYADTFAQAIIPHLTSNARIANTVAALPDSGAGAFTGPSILIPYHTSITVLNDSTELAIPLGSIWALADSSGQVEVFTV